MTFTFLKRLTKYLIFQMNSSLEGKYVSLCLPCAVSVPPGAQKMYSFLKQKKANLMTKADLKKANSGIKAILKMVIHLYIYR